MEAKDGRLGCAMFETRTPSASGSDQTLREFVSDQSRVQNGEVVYDDDDERF